MSPNELSSALRFLELTVFQRSSKTTYKQGLDFVHSYCSTDSTKGLWAT